MNEFLVLPAFYPPNIKQGVILNNRVRQYLIKETKKDIAKNFNYSRWILSRRFSNTLTYFGIFDEVVKVVKGHVI